MTILLADLISRLTADCPAVSGVPTTAQYEQAVKDAVVDLSRRASVVRVATLAIVAGTASYTVPSDFQKLIRLAQIGAVYGLSSDVDYGVYGGAWERDPRGGVYVSPAGLVPFSGSYREQITVAGDTLTIYPTPTVSADRQLVYAAGDALVSGEYPTLTEDRASIALLLAKATCLDRIASSPGGVAGAGAVKKITTGGDTVEYSDVANSARTTAADFRQQYLAAIQSLNAGGGGLM